MKYDVTVAAEESDSIFGGPQIGPPRASLTFRKLVEQSLVGTFVVRLPNMLYMNRRAASILGHEKSDGPIPLRDLVDNSSWNQIEGSIEKITSGEVSECSIEFLAKTKEMRQALVGAHLAAITYKDTSAVMGVMTDITEQKAAEELTRRHIESIEQSVMSTVMMTMQIMDYRDPYTAGHERRVGELSATLGRAIGLDENRCKGLKVAGFLHDIGKVTIPVEMLSKPVALSALERELLKQHAEAGYKILKNVVFPWPIANCAHQHHERLDGSGYPQGLVGSDIILEARILSVADVIEAMASHRPYRPSLGLDRALAEIERGRGTAYDPDIADAALHLFRNTDYTIPI